VLFRSREHGGPLTVRADGRTLPARVILTERASDWAALEVQRELPCVVAITDDAKAGDEVLMIGGSSGHSRGKIAAFDRHNERDVILADYESISGDSGGGVFVRGSLVAVHVGRYGERARCPCRITAFVARAIRGERASVVKPSSVGSDVPMKVAPKTAPKVAEPAPVPKAAPVAPPVTSCPVDVRPLPSYTPVERRGVFGFRRW